MAYIKIKLDAALMDGHNVTFKAPCDCTAIEGLKVCYIENNSLQEKTFSMKDTHGNTLAGLGNLFAAGSYVHAILDSVNLIAYLQNAATNGYLEGKLKAAEAAIAADHAAIEQLVNNQIPEEYLQACVDDYISNNQSGLASKTDLENLNSDLSSEIESNNNNLSSEIANVESDYYIYDEVKTVANVGLYSSNNMNVNTSMGGKYTTLNVAEKEEYLISGRQYNDDFRLVVFKDSNGSKINSTAEVVSGWNTDILVVVPSGAVEMVVNGETNKVPIVKAKTPKVIGSKSINTDTITEEVRFENECLMQRLLFEMGKNPFEYAEFDKGYATFVFDDGRSDIDKVASIFAEFGYPLNIALPPSTLSNVCNGLTAQSQGFSVGMTVKSVAQKVVENGGEVLAHGFDVITADNYTDNSVMKSVFYDEKKQLVENGFEIRGIIANGGTGVIYPKDNPQLYGKAFEKWVNAYYDYSDVYGIAPNYNHQRFYWGTTEANNIAQLNSAKNNKTWVSFMCHTLNDEATYGNETMLRNLLQYCKDNDIEVVTYSYIFDNFTSSKLEKMIG